MITRESFKALQGAKATTRAIAASAVLVAAALAFVAMLPVKAAQQPEHHYGPRTVHVYNPSDTGTLYLYTKDTAGTTTLCITFHRDTAGKETTVSTEARSTPYPQEDTVYTSRTPCPW